MKIPLNLSKHCIETEIKRLYNKALSDYFRSKAENSELEQTVSIAQQALETFDFRKLRSQYSDLAGSIAAEVLIVKDENEGLTLIINNKTISPAYRKLD